MLGNRHVNVLATISAQQLPMLTPCAHHPPHCRTQTLKLPSGTPYEIQVGDMDRSWHACAPGWNHQQVPVLHEGPVECKQSRLQFSLA